MHVKIVRNAASRTIRDDSAYYSLPSASGEAFRRFKRDFLTPMRANLSKSLRMLVAQGASSVLEIGPGEGSGSDIAIQEGIRSVSMAELRPSAVAQLAKKYRKTRGDASITIYEGDVRHTLPTIRSKSIDAGIVFDNTLSNMQEPLSPSGLERDDFRAFVLSELVRISRLSVIVGLSSTMLIPLYLELGQGIIRETSPDGKVSVFRSGIVSQRYDDADVAALLYSAGIENAVILKDRGIYWIEIQP